MVGFGKNKIQAVMQRANTFEMTRRVESLLLLTSSLLIERNMPGTRKYDQVHFSNDTSQLGPWNWTLEGCGVCIFSIREKLVR